MVFYDRISDGWSGKQLPDCRQVNALPRTSLYQQTESEASMPTCMKWALLIIIIMLLSGDTCIHC